MPSHAQLRQFNSPSLLGEVQQVHDFVSSITPPGKVLPIDKVIAVAPGSLGRFEWTLNMYNKQLWPACYVQAHAGNQEPYVYAASYVANAPITDTVYRGALLAHELVHTATVPPAAKYGIWTELLANIGEAAYLRRQAAAGIYTPGKPSTLPRAARKADTSFFYTEETELKRVDRHWYGTTPGLMASAVLWRAFEACDLGDPVEVLIATGPQEDSAIRALREKIEYIKPGLTNEVELSADELVAASTIRAALKTKKLVR